MKAVLFAAGLALSTGAMASTVVDFDGASDTLNFFSSYTQNGYTFTASSGTAYVWDGGSPNSNGADNLILGFGPNDSVTVTKVGGGAFTLLSADFAVSWYSEVSPNSIDINGSPLTIDSTLTSYTFNATGTSFTISGLASGDGYWTADNFVFAGGVPEPATWALMIGGFAMTGFAARRRRTALAA